jgi:hypothetical protein
MFKNLAVNAPAELAVALEEGDRASPVLIVTCKSSALVVIGRPTIA